MYYIRSQAVVKPGCGCESARNPRMRRNPVTRSELSRLKKPSCGIAGSDRRDGPVRAMTLSGERRDTNRMVARLLRLADRHGMRRHGRSFIE